MHFPLGCEKLLTHISLFLVKALPKDVMSLYSIYCIAPSTKKGERERIPGYLICAKNDPESFIYNQLSKCTLW